MNVLVACEESQEVCKAFRARGHNAFSCDIQECSGGHPEWHIRGDALEVLKPNDTKYTSQGQMKQMISFKTDERLSHWHCIEKWDLIIAHPPCTYLCMSGQQWCNVEKHGDKALKRIADREEAIKFFMQFVNADCPKIAIENPVGIMTRNYRKPDQYIHPYQFGHGCSKKTGLWLKGLPKLVPTNIVEEEFVISGTGRKWDKWFWETSSIGDYAERSKARSKTFPGIAKAMAEQWG